MRNQRHLLVLPVGLIPVCWSNIVTQHSIPFTFPRPPFMYLVSPVPDSSHPTGLQLWVCLWDFNPAYLCNNQFQLSRLAYGVRFCMRWTLYRSTFGTVKAKRPRRHLSSFNESMGYTFIHAWTGMCLWPANLCPAINWNSLLLRWSERKADQSVSAYRQWKVDSPLTRAVQFHRIS